ncbi:hypothetical protein N7457_001525 [Penicillium paradoxum]|uniref:uncharacterized protein n=1 Tax=Penicillium paradoxum TaxID=176176 RepID=UPI002546DA01|nr:uncharacterized protein N7457_001525 [Penicillium paradoxum]KAJ5794926.1 hypothetical protein N7457_001525 [Penicillium paradoxum]
MSDQPPSYGGNPNYAQQWPPAYPSMLPPNFPLNSDYPQMNQSPSTNLGQSFDYNMASVNANARFPGSTGPANPALFFPPQFPFYNQFDASQFPPPFPPMPFAPMSYPPAPIPTGASNSPLAHQNVAAHNSHTQPSPAVHPNNDSVSTQNHREEGELSEEVNEQSLQSTRKDTRQYSDLEEGETISSSARSATYNPPLSVSADPIVVDHAMQSQGNDPPKQSPNLRTPHNIRYNELVAEGINPVVLKRLYEEVGIKVIPSSHQGPSVPQKLPVTGITSGKVPQSTTLEVPKLGKEKQSTTKSELPGSQPLVPSAAPHGTADKPLERKELIARMLAEKAAKATSKEASPTGSVKSPPVVHIDEPRPVQKEPPVKEKSKAQTELARQRIEELKKQTLLKTQQLAQANPAPIQLQSPAPAIQHPLPLRPPVPEFRRPASLPGLHMSERSEAFVSEPVSSVPDSTPTSRANQRKRPRASDFDEPVAPPKKSFNPTANRFDPAEKLIIAISDDESLYGDDEDDDMELDSSPEQDPVPAATSTIVKPSIQTHHITTRASTSTPQAPSSLSDQGDIRLKDMEIQAMRRKIAELELRRKSKLAASRTQSPRTIDESGASSSGGQSSVAAGTSEEDSVPAKPMTVSADKITRPAPLSPPAALTEGPIHREPPEEISIDEAENGAIDSAAQTSASFVSDSAGSAMDESDDSSSDSSESSSESEDEPVSSPAQIGIDSPIAPASSEPIEVDSSESSVSRSSPSVVTHPSADSADESIALHGLGAHSEREMSAESDGYEPPEPDTESQSEGSSYSPPPFSPALSGLVESTAVSAPLFDTTQADEELTNEPQVSKSPSRPNLQVGAPGTEATSASPTQRFTPYTSPLRTFQAYRYHPNYAEDVPSGHRSLTYSHTIDSMKYMCPFELSAGGRCNDNTCVFQHLRDMTLSDDDILIQMGSVREGKTDEERETYFAGLKEIINDLRRDKVKDFSTVASEIAAYRRRFLQDPSRVLSL